MYYWYTEMYSKFIEGLNTTRKYIVNALYLDIVVFSYVLKTLIKYEEIKRNIITIENCKHLKY